MEEKIIITITDEDDEDERLDKFLTENIPQDMSRSYLQKLIKDGNVLVNSNQKKPNYLIRLGDEIEVCIPEPVEYKVEPANIPLEIVYEDKYLLIINKQPGLVVHPAYGHMDNNTLVNALLYYCKNLSGINGVLRPGIVHRLDKDTSGLMVVAKDDKTHKHLAEQLQTRTLTRIYNAIVCGYFPEDELKVETFIDRSRRNRQKMAVVSSGGKQAISNFKVKERFWHYTLMEVKLETGRTHQIRVHATHLGYPLLGDKTYGKTGKHHTRIAGQVLNIDRQALHAKEIGFVHPHLKKEMWFESELSGDIKNILQVLRSFDS